MVVGKVVESAKEKVQKVAVKADEKVDLKITNKVKRKVGGDKLEAASSREEEDGKGGEKSESRHLTPADASLGFDDLLSDGPGTEDDPSTAGRSSPDASSPATNMNDPEKVEGHSSRLDVPRRLPSFTDHVPLHGSGVPTDSRLHHEKHDIQSTLVANPSPNTGSYM